MGIAEDASSTLNGGAGVGENRVELGTPGQGGKHGNPARSGGMSGKSAVYMKF
jgi:hypothetical protein